MEPSQIYETGADPLEVFYFLRSHRFGCVLEKDALKGDEHIIDDPKNLLDIIDVKTNIFCQRS